MERGSDKVTPRVDEELNQETEALERGAPAPSRSEEFREQEAPAEGEPAPESQLAADRDRVPDGEAPEPSATDARRELARYLQPAAFPADRSALLASAEEDDAPPGVLDALRRLPGGLTFTDPNAVYEAVEHSTGR